MISKIFNNEAFKASLLNGEVDICSRIIQSTYIDGELVDQRELRSPSLNYSLEAYVPDSYIEVRPITLVESQAFVLQLRRSALHPVNAQCQVCCYYYGRSHNGNWLNCAVHPRGIEGSENCSDWQAK